MVWCFLGEAGRRRGWGGEKSCCLDLSSLSGFILHSSLPSSLINSSLIPLSIVHSCLIQVSLFITPFFFDYFFVDSTIYHVFILVLFCHHCLVLNDTLVHILKCCFLSEVVQHQSQAGEARRCKVWKKFNKQKPIVPSFKSPQPPGTSRDVGFVKWVGWFKRIGSWALTHNWRRPSSPSIAFG